MRIGLYAPLKAPDDPIPSGDRLIARMLIEALERAGHQVEVLSRLRTFDRTGSLPGHVSRAERLAALGQRVRARLIRRLRARPLHERPQLWFTYHLYHKAPDWIGPEVARALGIAYVVAEASVAARQADGSWAQGHARVIAALAQCDLALALNSKDVAGVRPYLKPSAELVTLAPFIDASRFVLSASATRRAELAARFGIAPAPAWLIAVGMFRPGAKLASYRVLAEALAMLAAAGTRDWRLLMVGDGPAAAEVTATLAPIAAFTHQLGRQEGAVLAGLLNASDLFVWPAIGEAIGMVFLEAQAAGLAVIGAARPGVAGVVTAGVTGLCRRAAAGRSRPPRRPGRRRPAQRAGTA
jgi:glycosyltransferase involved in cell wall biosynthesis